MSSSPKVDLKVDWCSYEAAKYAVEHWHYSKCMPVGKLVKLGVWEGGAFKGSVIFSHGSNKNIGSPFKLNTFQCCELTRVALTKHDIEVSRILSLCVKMIKLQCPSLRLIVSYADIGKGHIGIIYQAAGWTYLGVCSGTSLYYGKHRRSASSKYGSIKGMNGKKTADKHKYLYPLDKQMRKQIEPLALPYPKRPTGEESVSSSVQGEEGGASPTVGLHFKERVDP